MMTHNVNLFGSLSKEEKRMVILMDALRLIRANLVEICPMTVLQLGNWEEHIVIQHGEEQDLQKVLQQRFEKKQKCTVCERGLLLVATVLNDNKFKTINVEAGGTFDPYSKTDRRLMEYFDADQLALMEDVLMSSCHEWASIFPDETKRAIAILENAIDNGGIFKP